MNSEEGSAQFTQGFLGCCEVFTFNNGKLGESFNDLVGDRIQLVILKEHCVGWIVKGQEWTEGDNVS